MLEVVVMVHGYNSNSSSGSSDNSGYLGPRSTDTHKGIQRRGARKTSHGGSEGLGHADRRNEALTTSNQAGGHRWALK